MLDLNTYRYLVNFKFPSYLVNDYNDITDRQADRYTYRDCSDINSVPFHLFNKSLIKGRLIRFSLLILNKRWLQEMELLFFFFF